MRTFVLLGAVIVLLSVCGIAIGQPKPKSTPKPKATAAGSAAAKCLNNSLTASEVTDLLAAHNKARADEKLPPLVWDCKLAELAQQWANKGDFAHREDTHYGENLFVSSNTAEAVGSGVKQWMKEKAYWTNKTGTCTPGKFCTHYTQIMWNTTTHVGCGINRNSPKKWKTLLVCNYDPAGNSKSGPAY
jgi:uncharacterized protein YkwD